MEKINILIFRKMVDDSSFRPVIYCVYELSDHFFEFKMKISAEFLQDFNGIYKDIQREVIIDLISDHKENSNILSVEQLVDISQRIDTDKVLIPYIRKEKLNKLNI